MPSAERTSPFVVLTADARPPAKTAPATLGSGVIKQPSIHRGEPRLVGGGSDKSHSRPRIELLYDHDEVIGARVVCTCGQVTEIHFEYADTP